VQGASSAAVLYRRRAICQIGMFVPDFFCEDVDVALRLISVGWICMYVPTAIVYHFGAVTGKPLEPFKIYLLQRNSCYKRTKNLKTSLLLKFLIRGPQVFFEEIVMKKIKNSEVNLILPYLKGNLDELRHFKKVQKRRNNLLFHLFSQLSNKRHRFLNITRFCRST
jgi:GT2 family glycosyltransferase